MNDADLMDETRVRYADALARGQPDAAQLAIDRALGLGASRADIYLRALAPCQAELGERWRGGVVGIAEVHLATTITLGAMDTLRRGAEPGPRVGFKAVVAPVEGDRHNVGARFVADFLMMDGWRVDFLGDDAPAGDLAEFVRQRGYDLAALSSTMPEFLPNVAAATDAIRSLDGPIPKILLGGRAVEELRPDPFALGCDAIAGNALDAVREARRLVGATEGALTLEDRLAALGKRVRAVRTGAGMTQRELGDACGLDRTYISAVERGKQNLSVGALHKIAQALDMPMSELVAGDS